MGIITQFHISGQKDSCQNDHEEGDFNEMRSGQRRALTELAGSKNVEKYEKPTGFAPELTGPHWLSATK